MISAMLPSAVAESTGIGVYEEYTSAEFRLVGQLPLDAEGGAADNGQEGDID